MKLLFQQNQDIHQRISLALDCSLMNRISVQTHIRAHNINIKYFAFHVSAVRQEICICPGVGCRVSGVAGLAETITNSVMLKLNQRLSLEF